MKKALILVFVVSIVAFQSYSQSNTPPVDIISTDNSVVSNIKDSIFIPTIKYTSITNVVDGQTVVTQVPWVEYKINPNVTSITDLIPLSKEKSWIKELIILLLTSISSVLTILNRNKSKQIEVMQQKVEKAEREIYLQSEELKTYKNRDS